MHLGRWILLVVSLAISGCLGLPARAQDQRPPSAVPVPPRGEPIVRYAPTSICSEEERAELVRGAREIEGEAGAVANAARDYLAALRTHRDKARAAGDAAVLEQDDRAESYFRKNDLDWMTVQRPGQAQKYLKALAGARLIDCASGEGVRQGRPPVKPFEMIVVADRFCTVADIETARDRVNAAFKAQAAALDAITDYRNELNARIRFYRSASALGIPDLVRQQWISRIEPELAAIQALRNTYGDAPTMIEALGRKLDAAQPTPCADTSAAPPAASSATPVTAAIAPEWAVPARPQLAAIPDPGQQPTLCTELDRGAWIARIDRAIEAANDRLGKGNAHLKALAALSGGATSAQAGFDAINAINRETEAYGSVVRALAAEAMGFYAMRNAALAQPLDRCGEAGAAAPQPSAPQPLPQPASPASPPPATVAREGRIDPVDPEAVARGLLKMYPEQIFPAAREPAGLPAAPAADPYKG